MPEIRHFVVTETRQVKVRANTPHEAMMIAAARLDGKEKPKDMWGDTLGVPRVIGLHTEEEH